jgi:uncharacterized membrane protein YczE
MAATMTVSDVLRRLPRLMFGLTLFGMGGGMQVHAALGISPWEVLHQGISLHTPLTIGTAGIVISFVVLLGWIPLRQRVGIGTILNSIWIGLMIDATLAVLPATTSLWSRWLLLVGGVLLVAIGSGFYIGVRLGPGPRDGLMTGLADRGVFSLRLGRTLIEGSALVIGWLLGGDFGVGTFVFALTIGPLVQIFLPRLDLGVPSASANPKPSTATPES